MPERGDEPPSRPGRRRARTAPAAAAALLTGTGAALAVAAGAAPPSGPAALRAAAPAAAHDVVPSPDAPTDRRRAARDAGDTIDPPGREAAIRDTFVEGRYESRHGSRRYRLWVPAGPRPRVGRPLVLMLHGCTQDADDSAAGTRMHRRAGDEGWLVLFPEQPPDAHPQRCWRWYLPEHQASDSGEPAVLTGMLEQVAAEHGADADRIHLAGLSAGGAMAAVLAATRPDLFAAVAIHSGVPYAAAGGPQEALAAMEGRGPEAGELARRLKEALDGRRAPPLLVVHGEDDAAVAPVNGQRLAAAWLAAAGRPLPAEPGGEGVLPPADRDERHEAEGGRPWRLRAWRGPGPRVELRTVRGLGHAWSGGDPAGTYTDPAGPSATAWTVDFFRRAGAGTPGDDEDENHVDEGESGSDSGTGVRGERGPGGDVDQRREARR